MFQAGPVERCVAQCSVAPTRSRSHHLPAPLDSLHATLTLLLPTLPDHFTTAMSSRENSDVAVEKSENDKSTTDPKAEVKGTKRPAEEKTEDVKKSKKEAENGEGEEEEILEEEEEEVEGEEEDEEEEINDGEEDLDEAEAEEEEDEEGEGDGEEEDEEA